MANPFKSIRGRLLIFGLCISLIPIAIITTIYYLNARSVVKQQTLDWLTAVAESRKAHVMAYLEEERDDVAGTGGDQSIIGALEVITGTQFVIDDAITALNRHLLENKMPLDSSIVGIGVLDIDGIVVASTNETWIGEDMSGQDAFKEAIGMDYGETFTGRPHYSPELDTNSTFISAPLTSKDTGEILGVIINAYDPAILGDTAATMAKEERTIDFASDGFIRDELYLISRGESFSEDSAVITLSKHLSDHHMTLDRHIAEICVVDAKGEVVGCASGTMTGMDMSDDEVFLQGLKMAPGKTYVGNPRYFPLFEVGGIPISAPIVSEKGDKLGAVVYIYYLAALSEFTTNRAGMGETGEVYLVGNDGKMLTESRFIEDAPLKQVVDTEPIRRIAGGGGEMTGIYPDYRGVSIVGASAYIPEYNWTLLTEIDKAEAFAPLRTLGIVAMIVGLVSAAAVIAAGIIFAFSTSRPIRKLTDATKRFAGGDLKTRVEITRKDETGELASSFNVMASGLEKEIVERMRTEEDLKVRAHEQAAVAKIGQQALLGIDLSTLMDEVAVVVAKTLNVEYSKVLVLLPDGKALLLRAGVGWKEGQVGHTTVETGRKFQAGYTLLSNEPVVVEDFSTETRFEVPPLLRDHGVVSGMSTVIQGRERPFGILGAHTKRRRTFTKNNVNFLQAVANILGEAVEHHRAEVKLLESEEKFRSISDTARDAIIMIDDEGRVVLWNNAAEKLFGYSREEVVGKDMHQFIVPEKERGDYLNGLRRFKVTGQGRIFGKTLVLAGLKKDGTEFYADHSFSAIKMRGKWHAISIIRDITERKEMEKKLAERATELAGANVRLKELDQLKSMFIASMSHELRTPLNSIIGFTGVVLQDMVGELNARQKDHLSRAYKSSKHLLSLINDIIDISTVEAGKVEVFIEEFTLDEAVKEAVESVQPQVNEKGLTLEVSIPPGVRLKTDRKRLLQCILNFLSNAVKFTEAGTVSIAAREIDGEVEISVSDTGIGIAREDQPKLFNAFIRLDSPLRTQTPGTGLGLYLTQKLATEVLGGTVAAQSEPGKGSTFTLRLPRELKQGQA
ncbi:MAG: ATP-binding protein [Candidatus Brocadiales bacterium]